MFAQVEQEEWNQWRSVSEEISAGLRDVMGNACRHGAGYRVPPDSLMKSLPLEAADRVRTSRRAMQAVINGERPISSTR
jgi:hypothetical protein